MAFFQPGRVPLISAAALRLRLHLDDVDALDLDVEELLDGLADLRLVRVLVHRNVYLPSRRRRRSSSRDTTGARMIWLACISCRPPPSTSGSAASVTSSERAQTTALDLELGRRDDRDALEVAERLGERRLLVGQRRARPALARPEPRGSARAAFVDGSSNARRVDERERARLRRGSRAPTAARPWRPCGSPSGRTCAAPSRRRDRRPRTAARGSCPGARGRCPSGATASRGRRRRARGSSSRTCPRAARSARRARPRGRGAA